MRLLSSRSKGTHEQLCVVASVGDHADNPLSIAQTAPSKDKVI